MDGQEKREPLFIRKLGSKVDDDDVVVSVKETSRKKGGTWTERAVVSRRLLRYIESYISLA